jgi:transcriptional regulator with XRE-family HTH domain
MGNFRGPQDKSDKKTLQGLLKTSLEAKGKSQAELARQSGVSKPYLSQLFSGKAKNPTVDKINKIAAALDIKAADLLDVDNSNEPNPSSLPEGLLKFRDEYKKQFGVEISHAQLVDMARRKHSGPVPKTYQEWARFYPFYLSSKK